MVSARDMMYLLTISDSNLLLGERSECSQMDIRVCCKATFVSQRTSLGETRRSKMSSWQLTLQQPLCRSGSVPINNRRCDF